MTRKDNERGTEHKPHIDNTNQHHNKTKTMSPPTSEHLAGLLQHALDGLDAGLADLVAIQLQVHELRQLSNSSGSRKNVSKTVRKVQACSKSPNISGIARENSRTNTDKSS